MRRLRRSVLLFAIAAAIILWTKNSAQDVQAAQDAEVMACQVVVPSNATTSMVNVCRSMATESVDAEASLEAPEEIADLDPAQIGAVAVLYIPELDNIQVVYQAEDNDYYLKHDGNGNKNSAGELHLNALNSADFSDAHTFIFGHNRKYGQKFGCLKQLLYNDIQNPEIWVKTTEGVFRYEMYSIRVVATGDDAVYDLTPGQDYVEQAMAESLVDFGTVIEGEKLLTLSTCYDNTHQQKLVVQAVMQ